ncbi:MAG: hypothetical protein ACF8PG_00975, partial [Maioricimonas sp. JB045]
MEQSVILVQPATAMIRENVLLTAPPPDRSSEMPTGRVISVRSSVVDVHFATELPAVNSCLIVHTDSHAETLVEVLAQLDATTVRGIALQSTRGIARGM